MEKLRKYFEGVVPFFAMEAIQYFIVYALYILYSIVIGIQIGLEKGVGFLSDSTEFTLVIENAMTHNILYLFSFLGVVGYGIVFFFWYRHEIRGEVRGKLRTLLEWKNVVSFVFLGVGCQFLLSGIMSLLQPLLTNIFDDYAQQVEKITNGNGILVLLLTIIIAPIAEELVFRGVILHKTMRVIPFLGANILQALMFGIYHWNLVQGIYAILMGFLLGLVYYRYKTIFAPIILHMLINASALLTMLVPGTAISFAIMAVAGGISIIVPLSIIKPFDIMKKK